MTKADWRRARIVSNESAASDMITLVLEPFECIPHEAGQHYDIRFPGEDLSRAYSIVSAPERADLLEFGIQVLPTGQISPRLARTLAGDILEIRGPLGQFFNWRPELGRSLILLGGGAGITPLISIRDHFNAAFGVGRCRFLMSSKTKDRVYHYARYRDSLILRFTESQPRLAKSDLAEGVGDIVSDPDACARICGPGSFRRTMAEYLLSLGMPVARIRSEGFA